jgi:hypothetical protein
MTDTPAPVSALTLPEGPYSIETLPDTWLWSFFVRATDGASIARTHTEETAKLIASLPNLVKEIERLRSQRETDRVGIAAALLAIKEATAVIDDLRALNAEQVKEIERQRQIEAFMLPEGLEKAIATIEAHLMFERSDGTELDHAEAFEALNKLDASLPNLVKEIERLKDFEHIADALNGSVHELGEQNDRLRALNAEQIKEIERLEKIIAARDAEIARLRALTVEPCEMAEGSDRALLHVDSGSFD